MGGIYKLNPDNCRERQNKSMVTQTTQGLVDADSTRACFCTTRSKYLFTVKYVLTVLDMTEKNIFPSTSSREISLNWVTAVVCNPDHMNNNTLNWQNNIKQVPFIVIHAALFDIEIALLSCNTSFIRTSQTTSKSLFCDTYVVLLLMRCFLYFLCPAGFYWNLCFFFEETCLQPLVLPCQCNI